MELKFNFYLNWGKDKKIAPKNQGYYQNIISN